MRFFDILRCRPDAALGIAIAAMAAAIFIMLRWSDTHLERPVIDCGPTDTSAEGNRTDYVFQILTKPIPEDICDRALRESQPQPSGSG